MTLRGGGKYDEIADKIIYTGPTDAFLTISMARWKSEQLDLKL